MRLWLRLFLAGIPCALLATIAIAERALRMPGRATPPDNAAAGVLAATGARLDAVEVSAADGALLRRQSRDRKGASRPVEVSAADGALLRAWLFTPRAPNGAAVIALHGVGATRLEMLSRAQFLLDAGYTVLTPDSRGHGESGGPTASYGLLEVDDMRRWAGFVLHRPGVARLYGLGLSMGAAILIQTLPTEPRFRALVADSSFATFEEAGYNRLDRRLYLPRPFAWPVMESGLVYVRAVYSLDLRRASPADAIGRTNTPVLLIHGVADRRTPIYHSRQLHALNPATTLWEVPDADHGEAIRTAPDLYRRRVLEWFAGHP